MIKSIKEWFRKRDVTSWRTATAALRREYAGGPLMERAVGDDPLLLFEQWFASAAQNVKYDVNAFVLSTAAEGRPAARVVLLKGFDERGFVFYTNYESDKAKEIASNPNVSLTFHWQEEFRQVRIEGVAGKLPAVESDRYFASRPAESNFSAMASPQSRVVSGREELDGRLREVRDRFAGKGNPPRPANWGGFRIVPNRYEFWQGRTNRLHDRIVFELVDGTWLKKRLAP